MKSVSQTLQVASGDGTGQNSQVYVDGYTTSASFTTAGNYLGCHLGYSITVSFPSTGTPNVTVKLQGCNDLARAQDQCPDSALVNWFDIGFLDPSTGTWMTSKTLTGATQQPLNDSGAMYLWVRLVVTVNSGSVTMTAKINKKEVT